MNHISLNLPAKSRLQRKEVRISENNFTSAPHVSMDAAAPAVT
jgi:hypothetical protein